MSIRTRLNLWFGGILLVSLLILTGAVHYEFTEQQVRLRQTDREPEPIWEETAEIILHYGLPTTLLLLGGSWLLVRKALAPITVLTQAAEKGQKELLPLDASKSFAAFVVNEDQRQCCQHAGDCQPHEKRLVRKRRDRQEPDKRKRRAGQ